MYNNGVYNNDSLGAAFALLGGMAIVVAIIAIAVAVLMIIGMWKMFEKAGEPGWKSLIPIYSTYTLYQISWNTNMFWVFLGLDIATMVVSILPALLAGLLGFALSIGMLVITIMQTHKLSKSFGNDVGFTIGLILLPGIFYPILGFGSSEYEGPQD